MREFVIDAEGNRAKFVYDGHDRLTQWQLPSKTKAAAYDDSTPTNALASAGAVNAGDFEEYGYDANGNRTSLRKRDGRTIGYSFDALNRMIFKNWPATTGGDVTYAYDLRGLQLSAIVASGLGITNTYDGFGQVTSSTSDMGGIVRTLSYQYDADGNRTRITHPDGQFFTYDHDGLDRMKVILEGASTTLVSIAYDQLGRRLTLARTGAGATTYGYDDASRLETLTHDLAGTANDQALTFAYNPASQIVSRTGSNDAYAWTEHGSGSIATGVNGLNQIASKAGTAFTYDANGNLTFDGTFTYSYDVENRLTNATSAAGNVNLFYDPLGRLWRVTGGLVTDVHLLHDGDQLALEYNIGGGAVRYRFVHGPGVDEPLLQYDGATLGTKRHLHADHQGSVIALTDAAGANPSLNRYDEYGVPQSTNSGRFGYTGQAWLKEIGLNYYKARMYKPAEGVFMQTDPVGYDDQINLYAYVAADPVNNIDPDGQEAERGEAIGNLAELVLYATRMSAARTNSEREAVARNFQTNFRAKGNTLGASKASEDASRAARAIERSMQALYRDGKTPTRAQLESWASNQGFMRTQSESGPTIYRDDNGVARLTIKDGSARTPGSEGPHISVRRADGQRIDPTTGQPTSRRSEGNHRAFDDDDSRKRRR